jgi:HPt (histidine-containing phosphotransfer) domain-containing protein
LKSAAAVIGATSLSKEAEDLEAAGKAGDRGAIEGTLSGFYEHLKETVKEIKTALELAGRGQEKPEENGADYFPLFNALLEALKVNDIETIDRLLTELERSPLDAKTREAAQLLSDQVLMSNFEAAIDTVSALLNVNKKE